MPQNFVNLHSYSFDNCASELYDLEYRHVINQIQEKYKITIREDEFNITHINFSSHKCNVWIKILNLADEFSFK